MPSAQDAPRPTKAEAYRSWGSVSASAVSRSREPAVSTGAPPSAMAVQKRRTSVAVETSPPPVERRRAVQARDPAGRDPRVQHLGDIWEIPLPSLLVAVSRRHDRLGGTELIGGTETTAR